MNSFGVNFRIALFGESHGAGLGVVMDGVPAGLPLSAEDFERDLARRRGGRGGSGWQGETPGGADLSAGVTPRRESDSPEILSGLFEGHTTGAPLAVLFRNENTRSEDYARLTHLPRPSHADLVARQKFGGHNDPRGGGHFSGRVTLPLVAAGVVAKKILGKRVSVEARIVEIAGCRDAARFGHIVAQAASEGDSVGGVIECRARGVPAGWGESFFDGVESVCAHLFLSIPGVKGVEFGSGFEGATLRGSQNNDPIVDADGGTATNNSGGIVGGITNGAEIVARLAVKPTASIALAQQSYNFATGRVETLEIGGRHDACIAIRAAVVVEAALAIALADLSLTAGAR